MVYLHRAQFQEASALLTAVAEIQEKTLGPEHPDTVTTKANLALTKRYLRQLKEAEELEVDILNISRRTLGPEHPDTLVSMANLALTLADQGRWEEAEDLNRQVVSAASTVLGPEHPDSLTSMANLVSLFINQNRWDEAETLAAQVLETRKRVLGPQQPETVTSALQWAAILKGQGRLGELIESVIEVQSPSHETLRIRKEGEDKMHEPVFAHFKWRNESRQSKWRRHHVAGQIEFFLEPRKGRHSCATMCHISLLCIERRKVSGRDGMFP